MEQKQLYHLGTDGKAIAKIVKVEIAGDTVLIEEWLGSGLKKTHDSETKLSGS